ncbi:MAG: inorganic pyrophosphatase [Deinococcales bacterium]
MMNHSTINIPKSYWQHLQDFVDQHAFIIDRPKGQPHPRAKELIYPLDYGYLEGTSGGDGDGIDVWRGSEAEPELKGIICTLDTDKRDAEIKVLLGCGEADVKLILDFLVVQAGMGALFIPKPGEEQR